MRAQSTCGSPVSMTRAYFEGAGRDTCDHLASCEGCAADAASIERLVALGKQLPDGSPCADRVDSVFHSLMISTSPSSRSTQSALRAARLFAAVAASLALGLGIYLFSDRTEQKSTPGQATAVRRASIHSDWGADQVHLGSQPDEIVRLAQGVISVEVQPLLEGERFRVVTEDAEVEVRGTSFDVTAENDRLIAVSVTSGRVEVRPRGRETVVLGPGERWTRSIPVVEPTLQPGNDDPGDAADEIEAVSEPEPREAEPARRWPRRKARQKVRAADATARARPLGKTDTRNHGVERAFRVGPVEAAFTAGWEALVKGDPSAAAAHFDEAVSAGPSDPLAEDASFWRAVATDRSGAKKRAANQLEAFLRAYPRSSRAGEASCMLGWKLLESGRPDRAEALFEKASCDRSPRIRKCAQKGLEEIGIRR